MKTKPSAPKSYKSPWWTAAENIEKYGWIKHNYGNKGHGYCLLGALPLRIRDSKSASLSLVFFDTHWTLRHRDTISIYNDYKCESQTEAILAAGFAALMDEDEVRGRK